MPGELNITLGLLFGFALTLIRFTSIFVFLPWPGAQAGPSVARVVFSVACTFAVQPLWPRIEGVPTPAMLIAWSLSEAALGLAAGVAVGWISEIFVIGAQSLSVQVGYSFASTFDPNTQADSGILQIFAQLAAGLLFFATGMDHHIIRAFALSLEKCPPGSFVLDRSMATALIRIGGEVFGLALRLALPVIGLLFLVDLVMGVVGRVNSQMQIIGLSFPIKMLAGLAMLAALTSVFPILYTTESARVLEFVHRTIAGGR